jgi:sialidase-1
MPILQGIPCLMLYLIAMVGSTCAAGDMQHIVVHRDDTQYYITPWLLQLKSGELIVTMRESHARRKENRGHTDPTGRGILIRSGDGGMTWGDKTVVDDETYRFSQTEDVPVTQFSEGTLLLNLYSWSLMPMPDPETRRTARRPYSATLDGLSLLRSSDGGHTWSRRQPLQIPGLGPLVARCPALELPDGTLMLSVATRKDGGPYSDYVITSKDKGVTWGDPVLVAEDPDKQAYYCESGIVQLRSGKIILMHRTKPGDLYQSESTDSGKTWRGPTKTPMWSGSPAHLLELKDGRLLCTYGYRRAPFGVRACLSRDGGKTWDIRNEIVLRNDGGNADLGYPSVVEMPDGRLLVVYWFNNEKLGDPRSEVRYVAGTFFRP